MPTIVDSLLVTLGLDSSAFEKAQAGVNAGLKNTADTAKKRGSETEDSAKKMGLAFAKLRGEVVGLFLAFAGAKSIVAFANSTLQATAAAGRTGQVLGMSANSVNAWGDAIKAAGGDAGEAAAVFGKILDIRSDFIRNPGNLNMPLMGQLGIHDKSEFNDPEALMGHLADQYQKELQQAKASGDPNAEGTVQATFRQRSKELLGLSDNWIAMIERGRPALEKEIALYKEKDKVTLEDAEAARETIEAFTHLEKSIVGLFRAAGGVGAIDTVAELLDLLSGSSDHAGEHLKAFGVGLWGLLHPLDTIIALMASHGLISASTAKILFAGDKPWDWTRPGAPGGGGGTPGALGNPSNQNSGYTGGGYDTVVGNGKYGSPSKALTSMTMGEAIQFGRHVLIPNTRRAGVGRDRRGVLGSSAMGKYQITQETLKRYGQHLFGDNWQSQTFDAAHQERLAEAIFNDAKRGNLKAVFAGVPSARPGAYAGYSWSQARGLIARGETGGGHGPINVHVDARGATDPHKVATATGHAVKHALLNRHRVANANTGMS